MTSRNLFLFSIEGEEFTAFKETEDMGWSEGAWSGWPRACHWTSLSPSFLISKTGLISLPRMVIVGIKWSIGRESIPPIAHRRWLVARVKDVIRGESPVFMMESRDCHFRRKVWPR